MVIKMQGHHQNYQKMVETGPESVHKVKFHSYLDFFLPLKNRFSPFRTPSWDFFAAKSGLIL